MNLTAAPVTCAAPAELAPEAYAEASTTSATIGVAGLSKLSRILAAVLDMRTKETSLSRGNLATVLTATVSVLTPSASVAFVAPITLAASVALSTNATLTGVGSTTLSPSNPSALQLCPTATAAALVKIALASAA